MKRTRFNHGYVIVSFAIAFFIIYSYFTFISPGQFYFRDEIVNAQFTNLYTQTGKLSYPEDLNNIAEGIIHPINEVYFNGEVVSAKFLGFPVIDGTIATVLPQVEKFLTPILAIIGAIFLYLLTRDIFDKKIAILSFSLLFFVPAYWYWTSFTMVENIAGAVMLIISLRYFFKLLETHKTSYYILTGLFLGISLFIRPDFIFFVIPIVIILLFNIKKIKKLKIMWATFSLFVSLGPFFILNNKLYGSPLHTGQHVLYNVSQAVPITSFSLSDLFNNFLILVDLTPVLFMCVLLGLIFVLLKRKHGNYLFFFMFCLLSLSFYYLSGRILEKSISSSYVRYFIPVYILSVPFVSYLILNLKNKYMSILLLTVFIITNTLTVTSLINTNVDQLNGMVEMNKEVVNSTEPNAVIFLDYWDKAIFPERRVALVEDLPEDNRTEVVTDIAVNISERTVPVYFLIEKNFDNYIIQQTLESDLKLKGYELSKTSVTSLYKLEK